MKTLQILLSLAFASTSAALSTQAFAYGHADVLAQCYEKSTLDAGSQAHVWGMSVRILDLLHPQTVNGLATGKWISKGDLSGKANYFLSNNTDPATLTPIVRDAPTFTSPLDANSLKIAKSETEDTLIFENAFTTLTIQKQVGSADAVYNHIGFVKAHLENFQNSNETLDRQAEVLCQIFNH